MTTHFIPDKTVKRQRFKNFLDSYITHRGFLYALITVMIIGNLVACSHNIQPSNHIVTGEKSNEPTNSDVTNSTEQKPEIYTFSAPTAVKVDNRSLVLEDIPKNIVEEVVEKDFLYTITAQFEKKNDIWAEDEHMSISIENERESFSEGFYIKSYVIHQISTITEDECPEVEKESFKNLVRQYALNPYYIVNVVFTQKWSEAATKMRPQMPDGTYNRYFLVGKSDNDKEYKIYDISFPLY